MKQIVRRTEKPKGRQHWVSAAFDDDGFSVEPACITVRYFFRGARHTGTRKKVEKITDRCWHCDEKVRHKSKGGSEEDGKSAIQPNC